MGAFTDFLFVLCLCVEVCVLLFLEIKTWKTIYTPLTFLILPFMLIVALTIGASGQLGFVNFYYPSLMLWIVGLPIFAIPSFVLGVFMQRVGYPLNAAVRELSMPKLLVWIALALCVLFLYRIYTYTGASQHYIGSDDFGLEFAGQGMWGHLRILTLPLLIAAIYYVGCENRWLWLVIVIFLFVGVLYNVKGWMIIPCVAGLALRLYSGKTKLKLSFVLYLLLGGLGVFMFAYLVLPMIAAEKEEVTTDMLTYVFEHFIHYLTSGTMGLSVDMQLGFPDAGDFETIWAPIINLINAITGKDELVSPINPYYYHTGINITNVRTFFGTLYIYTSGLQFVWYILLSSTMMYFLKLATIKWNNIYMYVIYFFECGLLAMGWFEFYYFHLVVFELPVIVALLWLADWVLHGREVIDCNYEHETASL